MLETLNHGDVNDLKNEILKMKIKTINSKFIRKLYKI